MPDDHRHPADKALSAALAGRLRKGISAHRVPGASVAMLHEGRLVEAAAGVVNRRTRVRADTGSVFQIGSITKLFTATLLMQLVHEGLVELDAPVVDYLPDFHTAEPSMSDRITPRHLLTHTSGFEGDIFVDTGSGEEALERLLAVIGQATQFSEPGSLYSYSNAGFCVLGRLVEVLRSTSFDKVLHDRIGNPLGLTHMACTAQEAILFRAAAGHLQVAPMPRPQVAPMWSLPRSGAPSGSVLCMTAADLVNFSSIFFGRDGLKANPVLSGASAALMAEPLLDLSPLGLSVRARGLGWAHYSAGRTTVIGHDGATVGQYAFLRVVPEQQLAVAMLTNGGEAGGLATEILGGLLDEAGVRLSPVTPSVRRLGRVPDPERYIGAYAASLFAMDISVDSEGRLLARRHPGPVAKSVGETEQHYSLLQVEHDRFVPPAETGDDPHVFLGEDGRGRAAVLHIGGRALHRLRDARTN